MGLLGADGYLIKYKDNIKYAEIESTEEKLLTIISKEYNIELRYRNRNIKNKLRHFWRVRFKGIIPENILPIFNKDREGLFEYYKSLNDFDKYDFILGLWDGDGSICKGKNGIIRITIVVNSKTPSIINIIEDFFTEKDIKFSKYFDKRGVGCYNYQIFSKDRVSFLRLLYNNTELYSIERKRNNAYELLNQHENKGAHKDRFVRFGFDWFYNYCLKFNCEIEIVNNEKLSPQEEMVQDLISIIHIFSCRIYGLRKYKKEINLDNEIKDESL